VAEQVVASEKVACKKDMQQWELEELPLLEAVKCVIQQHSSDQRSA
jgi:Zn ribbon nucleic-acid-binding protein